MQLVSTLRRTALAAALLSASLAAPALAQTTTDKSGTSPAAPTVGNPTFPDKVADQYKSLSEGKAIQKTCLDQFHANKKDVAAGTNGSLKWKGKDGYYAACKKHLKGA